MIDHKEASLYGQEEVTVYTSTHLTIITYHLMIHYKSSPALTALTAILYSLNHSSNYVCQGLQLLYYPLFDCSGIRKICCMADYLVEYWMKGFLL